MLSVRQMLISVVLTGVAGLVIADDAPPATVADSEIVASQEVIKSSSSAADTLQSGKLTEEVITQQQGIVNALRLMLGSATSKSSGLPESVSSKRSGAPESGKTSEQGNPPGESQQNPGNVSGAESTGVPQTQAPETIGDLKHRAGLADAVWGHLPPQIRDELYRSYTERYVPQYDSLLRRYFEKLAEDSGRPDRTP